MPLAVAAARPACFAAVAPPVLDLNPRSLPLSPLAIPIGLHTSNMPGRASHPLLRCGLATAASGGLLKATACLEDVRGVIRLSGAGVVHFLQVRCRCLPPPAAAAGVWQGLQAIESC